jgi:hypothetical protein
MVRSGTGQQRMCKKDAEISSESDANTMYIGSLFGFNEIEEL